MKISRKKKKKKKESTPVSEFKIDFSFRREVFFIIAGALMGVIAFVIPITVFAAARTRILNPLLFDDNY